MATTKKFGIYVNDEKIKKIIEKRFRGQHLDFLEFPPESNNTCIGVVLRFLSPQGENNSKDVFKVLKVLSKTDIPAIILDDTLNPEHSKKVWLYKNTARYLPLDDPETAWAEIHDYLSRRIRYKTDATKVHADQIKNVGWSVSISPGDFEKYNLVSLFIGSMGDFMTELKQILEIIRPEKLDDNFLKDADIIRILEFKWALRHNKESHYYLGQEFSKDQMIDYLDNENAKEIFDRQPPSLTRNHITIEGETGTGKSIIADFIHNYVYQTFPSKNKGTLKKMSCANLGEKIMETQLFGSIHGAYTDAVTRTGGILEAYNGTVFLDEVGELPPELQAKLLYYLEEQTIAPTGWTGKPIYVPSLVVAATNRNLQQMVDQGTFRRDLHHRLGFKITIPPLRERLGDLERLVDFVLQNPKINPQKNGKKKIKQPAVYQIETRAIQMLKDYRFPGNFRELEQVLRRSVITALGRGIRIITTDIIGEILCSRT